MKELKEQLIAGSAIKNFPFFIQWHLTERCNLRCRHCYQGRRKGFEMSLEEVQHQIDGATDMFEAWEKEHGIRVSPSIHFTGGEPLLFKDLWKAVAYARGKGYGVAMMTNGCLVTDLDGRQARELGVSDIQVSLEGPMDLHDSIRGQGSFSLAAKGVETLVSQGVKVSANVTLSRLNAERVEETAVVAGKMGFSAIGFSRLVPCGTGKGLSGSLLSSRELKKTYQRIKSLERPGFEVLSGDPLYGTLSGIKPSPDSELTLSGCSAGFSGLTVTSDGSVMPCRRIGLVAGNLRKKPLRTIWASSRLLWKLRKKESYSGKCSSCSYWPSCRGCRAVAYAYSVLRGRPDLFADDPHCWHHPKRPDPARSNITA